MSFLWRTRFPAFSLAALLLGHALLFYGLRLPALIALWLLRCVWRYRAGPATALVQEAERSLPQSQYVYWRDDTHWNCNGMRAVAAPVASQLRLH